MAASAQLRTQTHPQPPRSKRRKRRETTISTTTTTFSSSASSVTPTTATAATPPIVTSEGAWCCASAKPYTATSSRTATNTHPPPPPPPPPPEFSDHESIELLDPHEIANFHSPSPVHSRGSSGGVSPIMDAAPPHAAAAAFAPYPSNYSKFNTALSAGLLNPMSPPPLDKTRSSPTLFEMMASEQDCHPRNQILPPLPPVPPAGGRQQFLQQNPPAVMSVQDRQLLLQERVAEILGSCSPGNLLGDPDSGDVRLTLTSRDGLCVSMGVHRHVLVTHSRFFAAKLSDRWSKQQQQQRSSLPQHLVEISDCDDVEVYVETLRLMYCRDLRRRLMKEDVSKVLAILRVSAAIAFDAGVLSCLEYLEAAPWAEDEEEKVASLLSQLRLESSGAGEVLKRVSLEGAPSSAEEGDGNNGGEEILVRLLQVVLEGKDEKARREMKGLVSKMLRENNINSGGGCIGAAAHNDLSKESLYAACDGCLRLLHHHFLRAAASDLGDVAQIARQADNLHWILDILIDRQIADEFLWTWATQSELSEMHPRVPAIHRYEVSRVTARLLVGIGKGQILVPKDARCSLLKTWLEPFYEDFGWMRRACKGLDRHLIEDGLGNTILTLPLGLQQDILLAWFDRFLNSGDDCPNIQKGFEVWWRRAFWRRNGEPNRPRQLRITAPADNSF